MVSLQTLINFDDARSSGFWSPLTDMVRGGKSTAFMRLLPDATAEISGELTLIENAGFASYRVTRSSGADWNLSGAKALLVEASGDGRVYKILLKDKAARTAARDYSWECELPTDSSGKMQTTRLLLSAFVATRRGAFLPNVSPLDISQIGQIGIQINDKIAGPFLIKLKSIAADAK